MAKKAASRPAKKAPAKKKAAAPKKAPAAVAAAPVAAKKTAAPRRKAVKRGRKVVAKKAAGTVSAKDVQSQLAKLRQQKAQTITTIQESQEKLLKNSIAAKEKELSAANVELEKAKKIVAGLEDELSILNKEAKGILAPAPKSAAAPAEAKAPAAKRGRKPGAKKAAKKAGKSSGRKARVSVDAKKAVVAAALAKHADGILFGNLKKELINAVDPESNGKAFTPQDFNSSSTFGKKYLPSGWKIVGARKTAKVVPGK